MKEELIFSNFVDILSYLEEFFGVRDFIMFSASLVNKDFKVIFGEGFLKDCRK